MKVSLVSLVSLFYHLRTRARAHARMIMKTPEKAHKAHEAHKPQSNQTLVMVSLLVSLVKPSPKAHERLLLTSHPSRHCLK